MKKRIEELTKIINQANHDYYILENPTLSDSQYDEYLRELEKLEKKYPKYALKESPTKKINVTTNTPFSKINHQSPMLSLSNVFNLEQLKQFDLRIKKEITNFEYVCELKIDGMAVSLEYENGLLKRAATRGDGITGEDITNNIKTMESIPKEISEKINFEIRGEVFMSKTSFQELNHQRQESGEKLFANPRNAGSGSLRQLDAKITAKRKLDCFFYNGIISEFDSHYQLLKYLKRLGFQINQFTEKKTNIDQVIKYINEWEEKRNELPYEIDGIVIKIDNINQQKQLGITAKSPKWAIAFKFKAVEEIAKLEDIIFTVGRTGQITPNAVLTPVNIDGSLVSRTTLHNEKNILTKDLKIGDLVIVRKAGDVIPEVVKSIPEKRSGSEKPFKMIEKCPICQTKLIKNDNEAAHYCPNLTCDARKQEEIIHFASRTAMNIEGLGEKIIEIFYNEGFIKNIKEIYLLKNHRQTIIGLNGFGEKRIDNILKNIENSKKNNLDKLIFGLGIKHVGSKTAQILAEEFLNLDNLQQQKYEDLIAIPEIGPKIAKSLEEYFSNFENKALISFLKDQQLNLVYSSNKQTKDNFNNKKFVITGSFQNYRREEIKILINQFGGITTDTISKNTDILICGENPGSKLSKAKELKLIIWNEADFEKNVND